MLDTFVTLAYLAAASLFILGLKRLSSPRTARRGNRMAAVGMLIGVVGALVSQRILSPVELFAGLLLGSAIGTFLARRTELTKMPELVAAFNGFGGAASALVAAAEILRANTNPLAGDDSVMAFTIGLSVLIGAVTLTGSRGNAPRSWSPDSARLELHALGRAHR